VHQSASLSRYLLTYGAPGVPEKDIVQDVINTADLPHGLPADMCSNAFPGLASMLRVGKLECIAFSLDECMQNRHVQLAEASFSRLIYVFICVISQVPPSLAKRAFKDISVPLP